MAKIEQIKPNCGPEKIYVPWAVKITSIKQESSDSVTIQIPFEKKNVPGQFVQLSIPGIGECPISISSHSDKFLDLHIRIVGNMTKAMSKLKAGDTLFVRGPYGNGYPMEQFKGKDMVLVGGGCGVAPLRSIIKYVLAHRKDFGKVYLFFGFRSPGEMIFKEEIEQWKQEKDFYVYITVDANPKNEKFDGKVCFVTNCIKDVALEPKNKVVMLCGPPIMMNLAIGFLKEKGFTESQTYISAERMMHCAVGICGHCMIHGKYTCKDGPVFRMDQLKE